MPFDAGIKVGEVIKIGEDIERGSHASVDQFLVSRIFYQQNSGREYMAVTDDYYFVVGRRRDDVIRKITKRRANAVGSQFCVLQGLTSIRGLDAPGYDLVIIKAVGVIGVGVNYAS